jgi:hypothetical protein
MSKNVKYVKLLDLEHSIRLVLCDLPPKQKKLKVDLADSIAVTAEEVQAIYLKQKQQVKLRQRELARIIKQETERCRKLIQQKQD